VGVALIAIWHFIWQLLHFPPGAIAGPLTLWYLLTHQDARLAFQVVEA